ncbi:MAG: NAD(P)/FAD-dependent oxidoreductase [Candidatus Omnitrophota bacterium]
MENVDIVIVGAGVIGLAIAYEISSHNKDIYVVEKNNSFGQETSSRNSEVIHAGIYYPKGSLKSVTCLEGNKLIYELCREGGIAHKRIGKLIAAKDGNEIERLEKLFKHALSCGVEDIKLIDKNEIIKLEPNLKADVAIYSGSTGIVDTHSLMKHLETKAKYNSVQFVYNAQVTSINREKNNFVLEINDSDKEKIKISTRMVINSSGLYSDKISEMAGIREESYKLKFCKGQYFRLSSQKSRMINRLIYPVPDIKGRDLGIHATPDLAGSVRLGPDAEYISGNILDYSLNLRKKKLFYESIHDLLPFISDSDLTEDTSGIRPKLQGPDDGFRDFIIKHEKDRGLDGFINLIGIESPGLTASIAIARVVKSQTQEIFNER